MAARVFFWRRLDVEGLERLDLEVNHDTIAARSTVLSAEDGGFRLDHRWLLTPDWRAQGLSIERWNKSGHAALTLERDGTGWRVNGVRRLDLDGAEEPDLSVTPFCNSFPIRRVGGEESASLTIDTAFIDGTTLTVARSKQRYDRLGLNRLRYVDLGLSSGFEADLVVDDEGLILTYEHLFERIASPV